MADISNLFKATIKSVRSRNKAVNKVLNKDDKSSILPISKHRGQFEATAREVVMCCIDMGFRETTADQFIDICDF